MQQQSLNNIQPGTEAFFTRLNTKIRHGQVISKQLADTAVSEHAYTLYDTRRCFYDELVIVSIKPPLRHNLERSARELAKILQRLSYHTMRKGDAFDDLEKAFAQDFFKMFIEPVPLTQVPELNVSSCKTILSIFAHRPDDFQVLMRALTMLDMVSVFEKAIVHASIPGNMVKLYDAYNPSWRRRLAAVKAAGASSQPVVRNVEDLESQAVTKAHVSALRVYRKFEQFQSIAPSIKRREDLYARPAEMYASLLPILNRHYRDFETVLRTEMKGQVVRLLTDKTVDATKANGKFTAAQMMAAHKDNQREIMSRFSLEACEHLFEVVYKFDLQNFFRRGRELGFVPPKVGKRYDEWLKTHQAWVDNRVWLEAAPVEIAPAMPVVAPVVNVPPPAVKDVAVPVSTAIPVRVPVSVVTHARSPHKVKPASKSKRKEFSGWDFSAPEPVARVPMVATINKRVVNNTSAISGPAIAVTTPDVSCEPAESEVVDDTVDDVVVEPEETSLVETVITRLNIQVNDQDARDDLPGKRKKNLYSSATEDSDENKRTDILKKALAHDHVPGKYIRSHMQPFDQQDKNDRPYNVFDIEFPVNERGVIAFAQIFVRNLPGYATFVRRDTGAPFDPDGEFSISALRDDVKVWMVPFESEEQWVKDIQERLYTKVEDMEVQLKRDHFWEHRGPALTEKFARHVVQHGSRPDKGDTNVFKEGLLKGEATWCAALSALSRGTVGGLKGADVKTSKQLLAHLDAAMPGLAQFETKGEPLRIDARDLYLGIARGEDDVDGWTRGMLELAFRYGAVEHLEVVLPGDSPLPNKYEDFADRVRERTRAWRNQPE